VPFIYEVGLAGLSNKINALLIPLHTNHHLQVSQLAYSSAYSVVTKSNQGCSVPGPADYQVKKPLPQTATISNTTEARNLYKLIEPNPGPGTYKEKSYITVPLPRFSKEPNVR
jgi:hypothetical protein